LRADQARARIPVNHDRGLLVSPWAGVNQSILVALHPLAAHSMHDAREYDVGRVHGAKQVTAGLLAICLQEQGIIPRRSWLGVAGADPHVGCPCPGPGSKDIEDSPKWNAGSRTGRSVVLAGFSGILVPTPDHDTWPGRLRIPRRCALAAALRADRCDIYTDVDGVLYLRSAGSVTPRAQAR